MIERALQEYRQVERVKRQQCDGGDPGPIRWICYFTQQRWKIEDKSRSQYSPALNGPPDDKADEFIGVIDGRPLWQPMKYEWRDLPIVTEEEANG